MTKKWYQSKTIWLNILGGIGSVGLAFGLDLGLTPEVQSAIAMGGIALVNLILRLVTSKGIG